jgi:cytochrome c5
MKQKSLVILLGLIVVLLVVTSCGGGSTPTQAPAPAAQDNPSKALFESKCSTCHALAIPQAKKNDLAGWTVTVESMVQKGAQLTAEQQTQIAEYLAATYPK